MQVIFVFTVFILTVFAASAAQPPEVKFELVEVAAGILVHPGRQVDINNRDRGDSANIGFIIGDGCVAVVDSGGSLRTGRRLLTVIKKHTPVPICYVINTHVHFDHVLGNAAFVDEGVEFIGHQNLAAAIAANREFFAERFARELDGENPHLVIGPTKTVAQSLVLDLGGRSLLLEAHPMAHTNTDLSVFDKNTKTLWTGDLVFMERLPILDGSLRGWLQWLKKFQVKSIARIVPGHGPASALWPSGADAERDYLAALLKDGREAIASGMFLEDAMEAMSSEAASSWLLNDRHSHNVSKAFRELEWE